ncbi:MAG: LysM peptidoglycan-binding domain-containing protein [Hyphomicrobiaceae bacterium]
MRQAALPEPVPSTLPEQRTYAPRSYRPSRPIDTRTAPRQVEARPSGGQIVVVAGDTLYRLSRQHRVSVAELMSVNGLKTPLIFPGQKLALPAGSQRAVPKRQQRYASLQPQVPAAPARVSPPPRLATPNRIDQPAPRIAAGNWAGEHTVSPRDSLYGIAREYGTTVAELQRVNGVSDPTKLRAGTVLKVPGKSTGRASAPAPVQDYTQASRPSVDHHRSANETRVAMVTPRVKVLNDASGPSASVSPITPSPAAFPQASQPSVTAPKGIVKFRWPIKGRIISTFGSRNNSIRNDGINILAPMGSDVHAAEDGTVAYAGSELQGYGKLLLIRHTGNWVSAYAHNETLLVKRGDTVRRGQVIAKAGKSGAVDQPQVHFELRQGSKPVDPVKYLEP